MSIMQVDWGALLGFIVVFGGGGFLLLRLIGFGLGIGRK